MDSEVEARRWAVPLGMALVLTVVYRATLLEGVGHFADTACLQFSGYRLCVSHWTGYPTYHLLSHAFTTLVPLGSPAFRANLLSAVFSVLACLVLRQLLLRLGTRDGVATATALAFGFTYTFWYHSITAEVYSLHVLFVALTADALVRWRQTGRRRDLILACGIYAFSFGNHLMAALILPAVVVFVLATRPRVLLDWRSVLPVGGLIVLGALQYLYPLWRSLDPDTPYLATPVTNLQALWQYAVGAPFHRNMMAFTPSQILQDRIPFFLREWWHDCGPLVLLALAGLARFKDRVVALFFALVLLGDLVFALRLNIGEIEPYFLPVYYVTAVAAGLGLEWLVSLAPPRRVVAVLVFLVPAGLCALHWTSVQAATRPHEAEAMRVLLEDVRHGALLMPRYEQYMQLLYYALAEDRAGPAVFIGFEVDPENVVAYVADDTPIHLPRVRRTVPPGLPVYDMRLGLRPRYRAAGLDVEMFGSGFYRISRPADLDTP